jgi:hypothetical protein
MGWIWALDDLVKLLDRENPLVRGWGMERLIALYPETVGAVAIRYLGDRQEVVARAAAGHLIEHPQSEHADQLLKAYAGAEGIRAGMMANAISRLKDARLVKAFQNKYADDAREDLIGYALSVAHIADLKAQESGAIAEGALHYIRDLEGTSDAVKNILQTVFSANLIAGNPIGPLFDFCFQRHEWRPWLVALLMALGEICGTWNTGFDLVEEAQPGAPKRQLPRVVQWPLDVLKEREIKEIAGKIEKLFRKRRHEDIINEISQETLRLVNDAGSRVGPESYTAWLKGRGRPRPNIAAIEALRTHIHGKDSTAQEWMARAQLLIFSLLVEYQPLLGLNVECLDTEGLLKAFLQDRGSVEADQRIAERLLAAPEKGRIVEKVLEFIETHPDVQANARLVDFLAEGMDARLAERLLRLETDSPELAEKIPAAVIRLGEPLLDLLPSLIASKNPAVISRSINLLGRLPSEASANLLLEHWEEFWEWNKLSFLEALEDIGDRRFIRPLKAELKAGELLEAQTYHLLCSIHQVADPLLKKIEAEEQRRQRRNSKIMAALAHSKMEGLLREPLDVKLKCRRCRKTYTYEIKEVTAAGRSGDYVIADVIRCKNCGVVDHYEKTIDSDMAVMGRMLMMFAAADNDLKDLDDAPLKFGQFAPVDGKARSLEEALV